MKNKTPGPETLGWWPARGARFKRSIWHKILKISSFLWWSIYIVGVYLHKKTRAGYRKRGYLGPRCLSIYIKKTRAGYRKTGKNGNIRNLPAASIQKIPKNPGMSILLALFGLVYGLTGCLHVYGLPDHGKPLASVRSPDPRTGGWQLKYFFFHPGSLGRWSHFD